MLYNAAKVIKKLETNKVFLTEMIKSEKRRSYMPPSYLFLLPLQEITFVLFKGKFLEGQER